ncbi:MAG: hypothetical protein IT288_17580 [Bdellovibrionales bacterium]|nr:hypothetical protein [Bdellovibrionales bacterium]
MSKGTKPGDANTVAETILTYVEDTAGLVNCGSSTEKLQIFQKADGKSLSFEVLDIDEVIPRTDSEGKPFLQVNFLSGKKILLTDTLVGFKPAVNPGLDMGKLPSVVTTPDLISVVEAIEESMSSTETEPEEIEVLRRVFGSVLEGGEAVGFDLTSERVWLTRLTHQSGQRHTA